MCDDFLQLTTILKVTKCVGVERRLGFDRLAKSSTADVLGLARHVTNDTGHGKQPGATLRRGKVTVAVVKRDRVCAVGKLNSAAAARSTVDYSNRSIGL